MLGGGKGVVNDTCAWNNPCSSPWKKQGKKNPVTPPFAFVVIIITDPWSFKIRNISPNKDVPVQANMLVNAFFQTAPDIVFGDVMLDFY